MFLDRLPGETDEELKIYDAVLVRVRRALIKELGVCVTNYVDEDKYTPKQVSAGWNRAMRNGLGYTVPCDRE